MDWFWFGALCAQSAMLIWCSYTMHKNARLIDQLCHALSFAGEIVHEQNDLIRKLTEQRDAVLALHRGEIGRDDFPAETTRH